MLYTTYAPAASRMISSSKRSISIPCRPTRSASGVRHLVVGAGLNGPKTERSSVIVKAAAAEAKPHWQLALEELDSKENKKLMVVQVAPAVRVAISEAFGLDPGAVPVGKMVTGLRQLGFDFVFDTLFSADLTIMEEGAELLHRLHEHLEGHPDQDEPMPMFTSCCPGWVGMVEKMYPEIIPYLSSCKSPQMMMGAVIKNYFSEVSGTKPEDICMCSVMPCTRKQGEADRPWFNTTGSARDVDHVITTDELAKLFKERGIDLPNLPEDKFDDPLGEGSGGALLFGTTGGVMEAALRNVYEIVTGRPMGRILFEEVRGLDGIKEATLNLVPAPDSPYAKYVKAAPVSADGTPAPEAGLTLRIAVANGLGNAKKLVQALKDGTCKYDFIEVMACPGGCIGGGGQPRSKDKQILQKRQQGMYNLDERFTVRRPHDNPSIKKLYQKYLGAPLGEKSHRLLHTHYVAGGTEESEK